MCICSETFIHISLSLAANDKEKTHQPVILAALILSVFEIASVRLASWKNLSFFQFVWSRLTPSKNLNFVVVPKSFSKTWKMDFMDGLLEPEI